MNLYFVYRSFCPGEAATNRALSYFNALAELNVSAHVVYLIPNRNRDKVPKQIKGVKFIYCWDHFYINNHVFKIISYFLYIIWLMTRLKKGDKVYLYDNADLLRWMMKKKGVSIFYEVTEHPSFKPPKSHILPISMKRYYKMCRNVDGLFVISTALKDFYIEKGVEKRKIHIINMTVDEGRFSGLAKGETEEYIAYCGTVLNNKDGVDKLIKAFALFHKKHPAIKLKIIGKTPPAYTKDSDSNRELISNLHLEKNVILTGLIPPEEMPQMLKNACVLVLARPNNKQAKYGFPTKLGEYLLTENPVVVTAVGDIPLFLKDKDSALLISPDDIEELSSSLCWVVDNPSEAIKIGHNGANVARKHFNNVTEMKKILSVMEIVKQY